MLTVISAVSGASISYLSAAQSDKRRDVQDRDRRNHEQQQKLREDVRRAAARFLVESRQFAKDYQANFVPDKSGAADRTAYRTVNDPKLNDIRNAYEAYWELVFICDEKSSEAARNLLQCTRRFQVRLDPLGKVRPLSDEQYKASYTAHIEARRSLVRSIMNAVKPASAEAPIN